MANPPITTDRQISALKSRDKPYEVSIGGTRGLCIRVFPTGTKSFEFRFVSLNQTRRRLPLGSYPALSLAKAREEAGALGVQVVRGADPAAERATAKNDARSGETLSELADAYFAAATKGLHGGRGRPKRPGTLSVERNRFDRHIEPALGGRRFREIQRSDVKAFLRSLATADTLAADTIASVLRTLSAIMAFAVHEERLEVNPVTGVKRPLALKTRDRMLNDNALGVLWRALVASSGPKESRGGEGLAAAPEVPRANADAVVALALRFALLTLARRKSVAEVPWSEIDLDNKIWIIPAERFKGARVNAVPLSPAAIDVLREAAALTEQGKFVFPSPIAIGAPIGPDALTRALTRTLKELGLPHTSPHDFRRAGATTLTGERYGYRRFIIGMVLGHAAQDGSAVTGVYDRNEYLGDKRRALDTWGEHVTALAAPEEPSNIISFPSAQEAG